MFKLPGGMDGPRSRKRKSRARQKRADSGWQSQTREHTLSFSCRFVDGLRRIGRAGGGSKNKP